MVPPDSLRRALVALCVGVVAACGSDPRSGTMPPGGDGGPDPSPSPGPGPSSPPADGAVFVLVGNPGALNESEREIRDSVHALTGDARILDDDGFDASDTDGCRLVVVSKTVQSEKVGPALHDVACAVLFWEDNAQMLGMMATIDDDGSHGTAWHGTGNDVYVRPDAPAELRSGMTGEHYIYVENDQITWAPRSELVDDAIVVAEFEEAGGNPSIYVLEKGARLADGTRAAGRRVYFGLYDDTFRLITTDGRTLFDAAVRWAIR